MTTEEFKVPTYNSLPQSGTVSWTAPSNIALIKYWGKREVQLPANPSLSFTLDTCATTTRLSFEKKESEGCSFRVYLDGVESADFRPKIAKFLDRIEPFIPLVSKYDFEIQTSNSFPHSSGIASSASGMAALSLCLMELEKHAAPDMGEEAFYRKASFMARLGSGSASRSTSGPLMVWGQHEGIAESTDLYAIRYPDPVHELFLTYRDTILLVDKGQKTVSSSQGHALMHGHPFAKARFTQAHEHMLAFRDILRDGNLTAFIELVEREALTLHSLMMSGKPYFLLMHPNTLNIINRIWAFREATGCPLCFTLDAGANVHLLYPESEDHRVNSFIRQELVAYCENGQYICDRIGVGPKRN